MTEELITQIETRAVLEAQGHAPTEEEMRSLFRMFSPLHSTQAIRFFHYFRPNLTDEHTR